MNCSLSNVLTDFNKGDPPVGIPTGSFLLVLKHDSQNLYKRRKTNDFGYYYHCINFVNKEFGINYVPEIWNGCDVWEQAFTLIA